MRSRLPDLTDVSHAVVLPGTGSDAHFALRAFAPALTRLGVVPVAAEPDPTDLIGSYLKTLDAVSAKHHQIIVAGISIGAAVATSWALENPQSVYAIFAALPAWTGEPQDAPASLSARFTAEQLQEYGLHSVTEAMRQSSPPWLGAELARSWSAQWPGLPLAMQAAAQYCAPTLAQLRELPIPLCLCGTTDDPVHPLNISQDWADAAPHAQLTTVSLSEIGTNPAILGQSCLQSLLELNSQSLADPN
ncbi:MAG: alpha/beta fold hydrolase [Mycobacteriaceae bacterium]